MKTAVVMTTAVRTRDLSEHYIRLAHTYKHKYINNMYECMYGYRGFVLPFLVENP